MGLDEKKAHYVVATCIVVKDGKYLLTKRADWEKAFPGKWTVPGGKLESKDYIDSPYDTQEGKQWYNICERLVIREVREEAGIEIKDIRYVTNLTFIRPDGIPTFIISLYADYAGGEVKLSEDMTEYAWVSLEEAKKYDLIDGIYHEIEILDEFLKTGKRMEWKSSVIEQ